MNDDRKNVDDYVEALDTTKPIWDRIFLVHSLVVIGTKEENGTYDLAPKHMAIPMGWQNYFGFVCTPNHNTYQNVKREKFFTVSYPRPDDVVMASLTATKRCEDKSKPSLQLLPTTPANEIDCVFLVNSYVYLECTLNRIVDDFGENSLIVGQIIAASAHHDALRFSDQDDSDMIYHSPLLAYLSPGRFAEIKESFAFPFPKEFKQ